MKILGLTGDIATGKSTVAHLLEARGARHLDADLGVRELYNQPDFALRIADHFGDVLDARGGVDREKLGAMVFGNTRRMAELEAIVHPEVARQREGQLEAFRQQGVQAVVVEAVKLLESGQAHSCNEIWCVVAWQNLQIERMMARRSLSRNEATARLASQPSPEAKRLLAGSVPLVFLYNNGTPQELEARVSIEWKRFLAS